MTFSSVARGILSALKVAPNEFKWMDLGREDIFVTKNKHSA